MAFLKLVTEVREFEGLDRPVKLTYCYGWLPHALRSGKLTKRRWAAFTPWHRVFLWMRPDELPSDVDPTLIVHEAVHVRQVEQTQRKWGRYLGWCVHVVKYLRLHLKHGYDNNPLEVEAREIAGR